MFKNKVNDMKLEEAEDFTEEINYVKFSYNGKNSHYKHPRVAILDSHYDGQKYKNEKNKTDDILGYALQYVNNENEALDFIKEIDTFASILSANKLDKYKRIKYFYPETLEFMRRYKKLGIKGLKQKNNAGLWSSVSMDKIDSNNSI